MITGRFQVNIATENVIDTETDEEFKVTIVETVRRLNALHEENQRLKETQEKMKEGVQREYLYYNIVDEEDKARIVGKVATAMGYYDLKEDLSEELLRAKMSNIQNKGGEDL